jgi:ribonuclease HI
MYFDGSLKLGGGGMGVLFISPKEEQLKYVFQILFEVSNNDAEYEASFTSCITHLSRHQIQVPSLRVQQNPIERS